MAASEIIEKPDVEFSMLGGLDKQISSLKEAAGATDKPRGI